MFLGFSILAFILQGVSAVMVGSVLVLGNSYSASVCLLVFTKDIRDGVKSLFCKIRNLGAQKQNKNQRKNLVALPLNKVDVLPTIS